MRCVAVLGGAALEVEHAALAVLGRAEAVAPLDHLLVVLAGDVPSLEAPDGLASRPDVFRIPERHQEPCLIQTRAHGQDITVKECVDLMLSRSQAWTMKDKRKCRSTLKHKDTGGRTYRRGRGRRR
jgi:hypothetical protein